MTRDRVVINEKYEGANLSAHEHSAVGTWPKQNANPHFTHPPDHQVPTLNGTKPPSDGCPQRCIRNRVRSVSGLCRWMRKLPRYFAAEKAICRHREI